MASPGGDGPEPEGTTMDVDVEVDTLDALIEDLETGKQLTVSMK